MSSSSSSDIEDQIVMALLGVMEQIMSILAAETGSTSAPHPKLHRRYVNHDHEVAHLRLHHNYFDDNCDYSHHSSAEGTVWGEVFS
jgi:hypothetical protein